MLRLSVLLVLALSFDLLAQVNGRLTGTVLDPSGAPVPAAKVEVFIGGGASALLQTVTNQDGLFTFSALRPEAYDVAITTPTAPSLLKGTATADLRAASLRKNDKRSKYEHIAREQSLKLTP